MFKLTEMNEQRNNFVMARWYHEQHQNTKLSTQEKLWPSSEEFFHPWNPVFADFAQVNEHLEYYPMLLLRDGAFSLLDFFIRFPEPSKKSADLIIQADLGFLVPKSWREKTRYFRMIPNKTSILTSKLIFFNLFTDIPTKKEFFSHKVQSWLKQFPADSEVELFWAIRENLYSRNWAERQDCMEMLSEFQFYFKNKVKLIDYDHLKHRSTDPSWTYVKMDNYKTTVGLCMVDSHMMANSCQFFHVFSDKSFSGEHVAASPLSFNHSLHVYSFDHPDNDFDFLYKLKKLSKNSSNIPYPLMHELQDILELRLT